MAEPIGALRAEMSVGVAQFASDMGRARQAVESNAKGMSRGMEMAKRGFEHTVKALKVMSLAAVAAGGALAVMVKQQIDAADAAAKTAQKAGTTVEVLTAMQHAANLAGVSNEALSQSMIKVAKYASDAARGTGDARHAYNALGISVTDATGKLKPSEQLMMEVADKFAQMEDGAGKTALAVQLFGRSGAELIPMLNAGKTGIQEMMDEAKALGLVLDTETAQAAERFNDNLTRLKGVQKGFVNQVMVAVLPTLETLSDKLVDTAKNTSLLSSTGKAASIGLKTFASVATVVFKVFEQGGKFIGGVAAAIYAFASGQFRESYEIMKSVGSDYVSAFGDAAKTIEDIWTATDKHVGEKTESIKKKVSAPTIGLKDEAEKVAQATEEARSAADKYLDSLEDQLATFGRSANEIILYRMALEGATEEQLNEARAIIESLDALKEKQDLMKEGLDITSANRTAEEEYADTIERLIELWQRGAISLETYQRAVKSASEKLLADSTENIDPIKDQIKELQDAIEGWGRQSADALVEFATSGKGSFKDFADAIIKDILRMLVYQTMMKPLFGAIAGGIGGGGWLSGLASVFGGGKAIGGPVSPGKMYEVNERGMPELLSVGNRQFLMMADRGGEVTPLGGEGGGNSLTINVPVSVDGQNRLAAELRAEIETTVETVIRRHN